MATTCPHAEWDPLGPQTEPLMGSHDIVCLHTMAGSFAGTSAMFHDAGYQGTESHFGIAGDGYAAEWQDLDHQADANLDGNHRCISIETADRGETFPDWSGTNVPPWTPAQLDRIVLIVGWLCDRYDIPRALVPDSKPGRRGIAYHRQGIDPWRVAGGERWSNADGKVCPGEQRIAQITAVVIPRLRAGDTPAPHPTMEDDDTMTLVRNRSNGHTFMVCGGKLINVTGESNVQSARNGGVPVWDVEADEYDRIVRHCGPVLT